MDASSKKGFEKEISLSKLWILFYFLTVASLEKPINEVRKMENPGTKPTNAETRDGKGAKLVGEYQHYHWWDLELKI